MKTYLIPLFAAAFFLFAAGCSGEAEPPVDEAAPAAEDVEVAEAPVVRMEDGVQVAEVTIDPGFAPDTLPLEAGVPTRIVFTRMAENSCATTVKVPELGVGPVDLPLGEPVAVEFTPEEAGTYTFTCGMDMMEGTLVVRA